MIISTTNEILPHHVKQIFNKTGITPLIFSHMSEVPSTIAKKTEVLLTYGNDLTIENLERFPSLKWIQGLQAGLDYLPTSYVAKRNIIVTNVSGIHVIPMSEYVVFCLLYFEKDMERYRTLKEQKIYDRTKLVGELTGRNVLIFGTGVIGKAVARILKVFQMNVYGVNTTGRPVEPFIKTFALGEEDEIYEKADYIISILPSSPKTTGIFSVDKLAQMKRGAVFINIGRGNVIDEKDLVQFVKSGHLKGAAIDVFQHEPLPEHSPLWECENIILTPHMSAKSIYYMDRCIDIFLKNWASYQNQAPMVNVIDTSKMS